MSVASRHISEEVNKKRQQIRKGIEDYIKYIDLHITLQRKLKTLCCGSENLDVNDVGAIFAWLDTAIRYLTKQINDDMFSDDYTKKKTIIEENQKQQQSLQQFRIRLLDYQTSQQRYGRLGNIPDKLDESHIIDLLQKRYNRLLKTPNEPLLETVQHFISSHDEDNNDNQGDRQIDYLYMWMSLIFFSLIDQLKGLIRNITDASQAHAPHRRRCGENKNPDHGCLFTPVCKLSRSYLSCTRAGTRALIDFPAKLRASIHHYTSYTSLSSPAVTITEYNMPTSYRLLISTRETIYNANYERELSAVGDCPPVLPRKAKLVDISKPHCLMPAGPG